jgi:hypothetical protein
MRTFSRTTSPSGASPFSKGFVEELKKVENPRVQAYLRLVESLNREIGEPRPR